MLSSKSYDGISCNNDSSVNLRLVYFGSLLIDKRYTSCMIPWIVAEIKRKNQRQDIHFAVGHTSVTGFVKNETVVEHGLIHISKCIKLEGKDASTFAYLLKDSRNNAICSCHVFEAENTIKASQFLVCLKQALQECKKQMPLKETLKLQDAPVDNGSKEDQHLVQYYVTYIGKLAVSHRKAPPSLIDTSIERFRHHSQQYLLSAKSNNLKAVQNGSHTPSNEMPPKLKSLRMNSEDNQLVESDSDDQQRPRSASDHIMSSRININSSYEATAGKSKAKSYGLSESDSLVMSISVYSITFSSSVSGKIVMERKVQEISFCQQGTIEPEHFGFICHNPSTSNYHCYVFKAHSKHEVDNIMKSLKRAFNSAWLAVGSLAACEKCPLHKLHLLCQALEGERPSDQEIMIRHHLMDNFGESVVEDLKKKCRNESKRRDLVEQNEVMMSLLRVLYEDMQKVHRHSSGGQSRATTQAKEKPQQNKFMAKAKRSLGDIFRSKVRISRNETDGTSSDEAESKIGSSKHFVTIQQQENNSSEASEQNVKDEKSEVTTSDDTVKKSKRKHRRSYSDISHVVKSHNGMVNNVNEIREHVSDDEQFTVDHPQSGSTTTTPSKKLSRKQSYRRAIFDSVVTPTKITKAERMVSNDNVIPEIMTTKKSPEQLRALWRKAILEQRLLIRMERENLKLRAGEGIAKNKRLKLEYREVLSSNSGANEMWNKLMNEKEKLIEKKDLLEAVKFGIPKNRRGEIWRYLLKQDLLRRKPTTMPSVSLSYKELKEMRSIHQHAILIDCNRTFPAHPYFSQHVGVGQFALFNLLKVYSNMDPDLGYCQGLSFVAGILLMHLGEEEAFEVLTHLTFHYGLRSQYMPDMAGLRVQFYQYSRLLHDACPNLHDHFECYEVTPTLYVASWFLTLFSSLFPLSFACRVLDLLCLGGLETIFKVAITLISRFEKNILACQSLETIVDFLKIELPKLAADEQESIVSDVLALEIGDKLFRFEVEYQVLQEENPSLLKPLLEKTAEENRKLKENVILLKDKLKQKQRDEETLLEKLKHLETENARLKMMAMGKGSVVLNGTHSNANGSVLCNDVNGCSSDLFSDVSGNTSPTHDSVAVHSFELNHGLVLNQNDITSDRGVTYSDITTQSCLPNDSGFNGRNCSSPFDEQSDSYEHILGETDDEIDRLSCDSPLTIDIGPDEQNNTTESQKSNSTKL